MNKIKGVLRGPWVPPEHGKMPYLWVFSLSFMLWKYLNVPPGPLELALLLITIVGFIPLYLASFWARGEQAVLCVLVTVLIGVLWAPWNVGASAFFVYAAAMCASLKPIRAYLLLAGVMMLALVVSLAVPAWVRMAFLLPSVAVGIPVGIASVMQAGLEQSRRQLLRKQEEVEHMATIAERERISRDLHDLLGHSLSLIALKAELAGKLAGNDDDGCRTEIRDIETSARRALSEVRAAVSGYQQSGLAHALASARASLAAANISLREDIGMVALSPAAEHVVALALREAVTNVVRHAGAAHCTLSLALRDGAIVLRVADDGSSTRTGIRHGNGLTGMRERAATLGGTLAIHVAKGLALELRLPAQGAA
ncbi:sensor histidine kinase [Massilia sp. GCM10020059]|uniref:Sensor histidine kinase n=1 Tax=Massilia agrisoli TaxID=2892444 RepID=A0ABS8IXW3_9BURK|nr:sensor histidine kinase [Massilia agrisoli]MCC6072826.1 sensor histidine kinase [Massilia agrisoli]